MHKYPWLLYFLERRNGRAFPSEHCSIAVQEGRIEERKFSMILNNWNVMRPKEASIPSLVFLSKICQEPITVYYSTKLQYEKLTKARCLRMHFSFMVKLKRNILYKQSFCTLRTKQEQGVQNNRKLSRSGEIF